MRLAPRRLAPWIAATALAVAGVAMVGTCGEAALPVQIALANPAGPQQGSAVDVAQHVIDSTTQPTDPRITVIVQPTGGEGLDVRPGDGTAVALLDRAVRYAAMPGVVAVVGPSGSRDALLGAPIYGDAGLAMVLPTANSPQLAEAGAHVFQLAPTVAAEGAFIGSYVAEELGARTATIVHNGDEWGVAMRNAVASALWFHGVQVVDRQMVPSMPMGCGEEAFATTVSATLSRGRPDVVVLATRNIEAQCLGLAFHAATPGVQFVLADGISPDDSFQRRVGSDIAAAMHSVAFWDPTSDDADSRRFAALFRAVTGRDPSYVNAMEYDAIMVVAQAIRELGPNRQAVRRYLSELGRERPPYRGVTGDIAFGGPRPGGLVVRRLGQRTPSPLAPRESAGTGPSGR